MLSILIPVYNYDCTALAGDLLKQGLALGVPFEIIVMDDGSTDFHAENTVIGNWPCCSFIVNGRNAGRAAVRNRLAEEARYGTLLFVDCDATVVSDNFLENYLPFIGRRLAVYGGCCYTAECPGAAYTLRWTYGRTYEARSAAVRNNDAGNTFSTFNFLIDKALFLSVKFDESIISYGHEDTLFGQRLAELEIVCFAVDNELQHNGIDDNRIFMRKTDEAVKTLYDLYLSGRYSVLLHRSRLFTTYHRLRKYGLYRLVGIVFRLFAPLLRKQLLGDRPSMHLYQLYKIGYMCTC
jgi:glycosyltransferase involved in cell wall biosynthesis